MYIDVARHMLATYYNLWGYDMNCLVVVNTLSGNYNQLHIPSIISRHTLPQDNITVTKLTKNCQHYHCCGYDKVIVCGGDGTLHHALNNCNNTTVKHLIYVACGTLNECAHQHCTRQQIGDIGGTQFGYVLACGTLTPIGYSATAKSKQKFKVLAYMGQIIRHYHVHNIPYTISTDNGYTAGRASLVMFLHSNRCFGLPFNKMYDIADNKLYCLIIRSNGRDSLINKIRLFLPLFRIFILGTNKAIHNKNIYFDSLTCADISVPHDTSWCIDGEQIQLGGNMHITTSNPTYKLTIDNL